jgi:hypothetical protein
MRTVVAVFPSREEAEQVARDLEKIGFPNEEVSIAGNDADRHDRKAGEWSRRNIAATAASGWGWFLAGLIPLIAERTKTAASLVGAALGAGAGLIIGLIATFARGLPITDSTSIGTILLAMIFVSLFAGFAAETYNSGVSHESEALCEEAIREHGVVVSVHVDEAREPDAVRIMNEHGCRNEHADANAWLASGWKGKPLNDEPYPSDSSFVSHPMGL